MNGSGIAAGDVDGDGLCDLYFSAIAGSNRLYRNLGNHRFADITDAAGVGLAGQGWASSGATFADLDGDGDLDLLVSTLGNGVQLFRNLGQGRFQLATAETGLTSQTGSTTLTLGDVDGDRDLDLYVVNYGAESVLRSGGRAEVRRINNEWVFTGPHAHRLRYVDGRVEEVGEAGVLYLNDSQGRFTPVPWNSEFFIGTDGQPKPPPLDYGLGAQMRDINGDGAPDLYICNDFQMPDRLWINDGRGRFREAPFTALRKFPFSSMGVDFGDLDRDGHLDFLVVEMASREHARALRQMAGHTPSPSLPGRFEAQPQVLRNALYRGHGDGSWSEIADYAGLAATDWSWQPVFLDVDLDGWEDVLVVNGMLFDTQDRDAHARIQSLGRQSPEASRTNLLLHPPYLSPNLAFRNLGQFSFQDASVPWQFHSTRISPSIALADLDNDGDADLIINCLNDGPLLYRNNATAPRLSVRLRGLPPNTQGIGARLRVEGGPVTQTQEIVAGGRYLSGDDPFRTFATGSATQLTVHVTWRSGHTSTHSNLPPNSPHVLTEPTPTSPVSAPTPTTLTSPEPWFTLASPSLDHRHHEEVFDDFVRQPLLHRQLSNLGPPVAWADLDGDGHQELYLGTGRGGPLSAFRFSPDGTPIPLMAEGRAPEDVVSFTGWVNPQGRPALLAALSGYESPSPSPVRLVEITLAPNSSQLLLVPAPNLPSFNPALGPIAAVDFDGDGDLDLFVGNRVVPGSYPRSSPSILLRRDQDRFTPEPSSQPLLDQAGMVTGAVWSDLDDDGFPELILSTEWGPLLILNNQLGRFSLRISPVLQPESSNSPQPLSHFTGWWNAVTTGDFNGDGRPDIVAANWGLNSGYHASTHQPLHLHHARITHPQHDDLIEAFHAPESGRLMPRRSLSALGRAFPFLAAHFPTHHAFSQASLSDVLLTLPAPTEFVTATTLASTLFLNLPDHLVALPLPPEAQYAPALNLAVADANADGHLDLFLAQNFFGMRLEWPRTDAGRGLWLQGSGSGRFTPIPADTSGVLLLGEQRGSALAPIHPNHPPSLVVAQNGASTTLWRPTSTLPPIHIEILGPPLNPSAYGLSLRPDYGTHFGPAREIRASSGGGSKDAATLTLPALPRPISLRLRWPGGDLQNFPVPAHLNHFRISHPQSLPPTP
jgi:hypothetical protein